MLLLNTKLNGNFILTPPKFGDARGYFSPYFIQQNMAKINFEGIKRAVRKTNNKGIVDEIHTNDRKDKKIIEVIKGKAIDIVTDMRENSPTHGETLSILLTPDSDNQILVEPGFSHNIVTLEDKTTFQYMMSSDKELSIGNSLYMGFPNLKRELKKVFEENNIVNPIYYANRINLNNIKIEKTPTSLEDCYIIETKSYEDNIVTITPYFSESNFTIDEFGSVVQANRSMSSKGVVRGLHFQADPKCQAKIVEVINGKAIDVVSDIRVDSKTYGKSIDVLLTPDNNRQLFVPKGYAHGFVSLEDNTVFQYLVNNDYAPDKEGGVLWNDPALGINWDKIFKENGIEEPNLSDKDVNREPLSKCKIIFRRNK